MKTKWKIILVSAFFFCGLLGYVYKALAGEKPTVAVVLKDTKSEYWAIIVAGVEKGLKNFGVKGNIYAPNQHNEDQLSILKRVLKEKPDALIFSPVDPPASIPVLKEFKKNHIPVLLVDTPVNWSGQTSFIGTDNPSLGEKAGELLSSMLQPGDKVALISRNSPDNVGKERIQGAKGALHTVGMETVGGNLQVGFADAKVIPVIAQLLKDHPDLKGVFASDDRLALEVIKYVKQKGLNIPVVGADGIIQMLKYHEDGTLKGSVAQNPYDMGYISVQNALKAIKGQRVEKKINSDVDIITADNAKSKIDFIKDILKK
ncbi:sugar ABC transporter substrate-binding protein [Neobacillus drentensis]|uniref:sugar ABC transporter substrate-binding protein n=1 Tax=Neobacillus drentensis TaxID=220684 RepID=UPI001F24DFF4|nr:sugar ABC transporter substrate-binding protein [Neobacillus drentensis]ULT54414.1 sugar ABC transporter substrate-binding protein [Neobacillus drentensis]